jgi:hypothetical protein
MAVVMYRLHFCILGTISLFTGAVGYVGMASFSAEAEVVESPTSRRLNPDLILGKSMWDFLVDRMALVQVDLNFTYFSFLLFVSLHQRCVLIHLSPMQYLLVLAIDSVVKKNQTLHSGRVCLVFFPLSALSRATF